jgi:hypothetical protein
VSQVELIERQNQAGESGTAQGQEWSANLPAQPLQRKRGVMANTVHREDDDVASVDQAGQQSAAFLESSVVVEKAAIHLLDQRPDRWHLAWLTANVEDGQFIQASLRAGCGLKALRGLRLEGIDFCTKMVVAAFAVVQLVLGFRENLTLLIEPALGAFAPLVVQINLRP